MKNLVLIFLMVLACLKSAAQTPNLINFQGVARGANGTLLSSKTIKVRLTIEGATFPSAFYTETRSVTTNQMAAFSVQIGSPGALSTVGNLTTINWSSQNFNLKVELDPNNTNNFVFLGMQPIASLPFAKYADQAKSLDASVKVNLSNIAPSGAGVGNIVTSNGSTMSPYGIPAVPTGTLTLPYNQTVSMSDARPLILLGNPGTGRVANISTNMGTGLNLSAKTGLALQAHTNSATQPAIKLANLSTGSVLVATTTLSSATGITVSSSTNSVPALQTSGGVKLRGTAQQPPVKGAMLVSEADGEAKWKPTQVACKQSGLWSTHTIPSEGSVRLNLNVEEYDLGNNMSPTGEFVVPYTGDYIFSGKALVAAFEDGILGYNPKLKYARLLIRITKPDNSSFNYSSIDIQNAPMGADSFISLSGESAEALNKGTKVTFYVEAAAKDGFTSEVQDASIAISLLSAWN